MKDIRMSNHTLLTFYVLFTYISSQNINVTQRFEVIMSDSELDTEWAYQLDDRYFN
jgi:hypothetical protein